MHFSNIVLQQSKEIQFSCDLANILQSVGSLRLLDIINDVCFCLFDNWIIPCVGSHSLGNAVKSKCVYSPFQPSQ